MTAESWDIDQAVARGPVDEPLEGRRAFARYGVTGYEEMAGEPLAVALAQEEPEVAPFSDLFSDGDDQWVFVEVDERATSVSELGGDGPEVAALHVETV